MDLEKEFPISQPALPVRINNSADVVRLLGLFSNRFSSAIRTNSSGKWLQTGQFHYLSDTEMLESLQSDSKLHRGCFLDTTTRFIVLGVQRHSQFFSPDGVAELRSFLSDYDIKHTKLYGSIDGGEIHLYLFFTKPAPCALLRTLLSSVFESKGIPVGPTGVTFPGMDQPLSLPLQPGFVWLNDSMRTIVERNEISISAAIALFLSDCSKFVNDPEAVELNLRKRVDQNDQSAKTPIDVVIPALLGQHSDGLDKKDLPMLTSRPTRNRRSRGPLFLLSPAQQYESPIRPPPPEDTKSRIQSYINEKDRTNVL